MKKIGILPVLISWLFTGNVVGQQVTGRLTDRNDLPIEWATVVLQGMDSTFISAGVTDTLGHFTLECHPDSFLLIAQHVLYETFISAYGTKAVGTISMMDKENLLNELVVKGERPLVKVENGALTYDVEQLVADKPVSNAYESLLELPGVREQDGMLTLTGASKLTVIVNGKPTTMTAEQLNNLLKNTPVSRIVKAEVMYSAPAKYHVRGGVINLVLKDILSETPVFQGEVNAGYAQKFYDNYTAGVNLLYSRGGFSLDGLYSVNPEKYRSGMDLSSLHLYNDQVYDIELMSRGFTERVIHNIRLGMNYDLKNNNKLGLSYTTALTPSEKGDLNSSWNFSTSENLKNIDNSLHNIAFDYNLFFGLSGGVNYTYYDDNRKQDYSEREADVTTFLSYSGQTIHRFKVYADQTHSLKRDWNLSYGMEFSHVNDKDFQRYEAVNNGELSGLNTYNRLKEATYNVYMGVQKSFSDKLSFSFSLNGEYYKLEDTEEWSLYPSAELSYHFLPRHLLAFSLSSDKTYPGYWEMQESVSYMNGYTQIHGNPLLKPYRDYTGQLSYIYKSKYILTTYFSHQSDYFIQLPYQSDEELVLIYKTQNWDYRRTVGVNLVIPFNLFSRLSSRLTLNGYNARVKREEYLETEVDKKKWVGYVGLNNALKISSKPNISMELNAFYLSPSIQGVYDIGSVAVLDAGIKWTSGNGKAEFIVKGSDLFNSGTPKVKLNYGIQHLTMKTVPDNRSVGFSFRYKFGDYKQNKYKEVDASRFGH